MPGEIQAIRVGAGIGRPTYRIPEAYLEATTRSPEDGLEDEISRR